MNDQEFQRHLAIRQSKMKSFIAEPHKFKVCQQCRSISFVTARVCPVCHAYRWDTSAQGVIETASIIGATAFPQTAGIVPRIPFPVECLKEVSESAILLTRKV